MLRKKHGVREYTAVVLEFCLFTLALCMTELTIPFTCAIVWLRDVTKIAQEKLAFQQTPHNM